VSLAITVRPDLAAAIPQGQCPLSDNSGQRYILARDGLSAFDPIATLGLISIWGRVGAISHTPPVAKVPNLGVAFPFAHRLRYDGTNKTELKTSKQGDTL